VTATKRQERRRAIGRVLRELRDLCEDDAVAVGALETAWELLDPEHPNTERKSVLVHDLPAPRWLRCDACIGGQEDADGHDDPKSRIVIDLMLRDAFARVRA
jgi:hypothetical protein